MTLTTANGPFHVFADLTFTIAPGRHVAIVGPSGSGKTMLLNCVAGLERPTAGALTVMGAEARQGNPDVGYVFARDALLPWRTARGNVELGMEARRIGKKLRARRAMNALRTVGLEAFADSYRAQLSQGMRQRVALARTFVLEPRLLLLDEPFAALDVQSRISMQDELLGLLRAYDGTVLLVTHDLAEAITLSDEVIVFSKSPARIKQRFDVDLPHPRSATHLRGTEVFQDLYRRIWKELEDEVIGI